MWVRLGVLAAASMVMSRPAAAEWMRAETPHFVVYADASEVAIRKQASDLELFDAALRRFQRVADTADSQHNKVTVFVVPSVEAVQRLGRQANIAGFYQPRVSGSVAFTPKAGDSDYDYALSPRVVLFHEYAHHFLLGNFTAAIPAWFSEGYAEFAGTAAINDSSVTLGGAANHRAYGLQSGRQLSAAELFAPPARMSDGELDYLYGRGWLLTHLVLFDKARRQQFATYLDLLNRGTPSAQAATQAFGNLRNLDRALDEAQSARLTGYVIQRSALPSPTIAVRPLSPGERALISYRMESTRGVDDRTAKPLFARARLGAAPYPTNAVAQGWLAEMAYDAGEDAAAEAAADAALAVDASNSQALLYKARVHLRRALKGGSADRWKEARSWILKANRANTDDAAALLLFYESFGMAGETPSPGAISGLYRVVALAPQDESARFLAARQLLIDNDLDTARAVLRPLAFSPHQRRDNPAAKLLAALDSGKTGPAALKALEDAAKSEGDAKGATGGGS